MAGRTIFTKDICPFATECQYKPANKDYKNRQHEVDEKLRHGIIGGYEVHNGGKWTKNMLIIDWEALAEFTHPRKIEPTAIHRSNVIIQTYANGMPRFLVAEGAILPKYIDCMKTSGEGSLFKQFRPWGRRKNKAKREARAHLEPYNPEVACRDFGRSASPGTISHSSLRNRQKTSGNYPIITY